ncbi:MAG: glycosyltransferase [Polyangiaceae bacterium]
MSERTIVVVPCYNEAARFAAEEFRRALDDEPLLEFVLVDDGSRDATGQLLEQFQRDVGQRVEVVRLPQNRGKAEAVRAGVLRAFELGGALIGYWDADLATPLGVVPDFAKVLADPKIVLVLGSRVALLGRHVERDLRRHYMGRGFATLVSVGLGLRIYDTQCGAKLFRANEVMQRAFAQRFEHSWTFDVELLARLLNEQAQTGAIDVREQCVELPLPEWRDKPGSRSA